MTPRQAPTSFFYRSIVASLLRRGSPWQGRGPLRQGAAALVLAFATSGPARAEPAPATSVSTEKDRTEIGITVYNQDFGLVREVRELKALPRGRVALEFADVAATIQPQTVHIRSLAGAGALSVLEQNYRFDLLTPDKLLEKYVGRSVRVYRYHPATGREEAREGKLLSVADRPVLDLGGEVTFDYGGRFAFPSVPDDLIAKPTLTWLLESQQPTQRVEVTYLARGLNWNADYVLVLDDAERRADLTGWVTLVNQSGTAFRNASLKLVAGDVQRVEDQGDLMVQRSKAALGAGAGGFREESLFEYHLYTLSRPTTVLANEQKQVTLLGAKGIGVSKKLIFAGQPYWFRSRHGQVASNQKVGVYLDFQNTQKNGLGMPLPKGVVRVYKADKSGAQQFVGEDRIDHTPRDEKIRVKLGEAFDVVADRKQTQWTTLGQCSSESAWEIELRNHKDVAIDVEIQEPVGGDWTIVSASHPWERKDAQSFTVNVRVGPRAKQKVVYSVRVRWC